MMTARKLFLERTSASMTQNLALTIARGRYRSVLDKFDAADEFDAMSDASRTSLIIEAPSFAGEDQSRSREPRVR
jgi:hypothetical protein